MEELLKDFMEMFGEEKEPKKEWTEEDEKRAAEEELYSISKNFDKYCLQFMI